MDIDSVIQQIDEKISKLDHTGNDFSEEDKVSRIDDDALQILNKIKSGETSLDMHKLKMEHLLLSDDLGITYLEYACKGGISFTYNLKKNIVNNKEALYICAKNNNLSWIYNIDNEDIFFEKVEDDKTLLDIILGGKLDHLSFIGLFKKNYEIIDYMIKYNNFDYWKLSKSVLLLLFTEKDGLFPISKYVDNKKLISSIIRKVPSDVLINYCKIDNQIDILVDAEENVLLSDFDSGKTILDEIFDRNLSPTFNGYDFVDKRTIDILVQRGRFDLLYNGDLNLLFTTYDSDRTYFDLMIEKQKQGMDMSFDKMSGPYKYSAEIYAKKLLLLAHNNMIGYIPEITSNMLLFKGKDGKEMAPSILWWINELGDENDVSSIIACNRNRKNPDFVIALRDIGIEKALVDIPDDDIRFSDECIKLYNSEYARDCTSSYDDLINELRDLFYNDGLSERSAIDSLVSSYRYLASRNNSYAILEVRKLIDIKRSCPDRFTYTRVSDGAFFSSKDGGIHLDNDIISTINHETSHALHYYFANFYTPNNYLEVIERVRKNPQTILMVNEYAKKYAEIRNSALATISKSDIHSYYDSKYSGDKIRKLASFLTSSKEEKKEKFKGKYPEEVLDTILAKTYSVDEFISQRKEIEVSEVLDVVLRNDYCAFIAIGDIIDAIYMGKYKNGVLYGNDRKYLPSAYGHGIAYYSKVNNGFVEMIAEYGEILKSKNATENLEYLRSIIGDELYYMIEDCYLNRILGSQTIINSNGKEENKNYGR